MKPQSAQRSTLCSQKEHSILSFPCIRLRRRESRKPFKARISASAGVKTFLVKMRNVDCWAAMGSYVKNNNYESTEGRERTLL